MGLSTTAKALRLENRNPAASLRFCGLLLLALHALGGVAGADDHAPPPPPDDHPPRITGEVHLDVVLPIATRPLCPTGSGCVFGGGGGIGGMLEWRWPRGQTVGLGYDVWFLDGNGVHELSTLQSLRAVTRRFFLRDRQVHPYLGASLGVLLFGEAFRHRAVGGLVDLLLGIESEITPTLSFVVGVAVRLFTTSRFTSRSDDVVRSGRFGLDSAALLQVGLILSERGLR